MKTYLSKENLKIRIIDEIDGIEANTVAVKSIVFVVAHMSIVALKLYMIK